MDFVYLSQHGLLSASLFPQVNPFISIPVEWSKKGTVDFSHLANCPSACVTVTEENVSGKEFALFNLFDTEGVAAKKKPCKRRAPILELR